MMSIALIVFVVPVPFLVDTNDPLITHNHNEYEQGPK